ncbi:unnamed protein product [Haemonchus placei]|uniref:HTH psq-type domain-containing protein n=1 Tax=Haemonchus placei TaxID=6290 RepID=A0A0N4W7B1_HAEPC|nr:unnamed protein product [Haemonchus placei]
MNLYTKAGGLFGTHVTWSDIEGDMQRELNTTASFGPNKSAKDIGEDALGTPETPIENIHPMRHARPTTIQLFVDSIAKVTRTGRSNEDITAKVAISPNTIITQLALQKLSAEVTEHKNVKNVFNIPEFMTSMEKRQKKAGLYLFIFIDLQAVDFDSFWLVTTYNRRGGHMSNKNSR